MRPSPTDQAAPVPRMRLDKWLWAARFFKTRQLAIDAINGGKVHLDGRRAKPGKEIAVGAKLSISKDRFSWEVTVTALSTQRRPAPEAARLYQETPESLARRQEELARRREEKDLGGIPEGRPNKRERRLIHRFKRAQD